MLTETDTRARGLADLPAVETDSLLQLIALCNADPRAEKIDVGVGVFRDGEGRTPILKVIKDAEQSLLDTQESKSYLGMAGDKRYTELLRPIALGRHAGDDRIAGLQTPGGCGALRLGFELIATANPQARVIVGTPTWPNHPPIIRAVGLQIVEYPYYDRDGCRIRFEAMVDALNDARPGDVVLLHGCCHNPTGADLSDDQWDEVTRIIVDRRLLPFVDIAYQGFARGLEQDARGFHGLLDVCDELIAAHSCDKNFSVYRDRVGSLYVKTGSTEATARAMAHVSQRAREMWSMPPDHGAAAVRIVLDTPELKTRWPDELAAMRDRINAVRKRIAAADPRLAYIGDQFGMFSMLPVTKDQVLALREKHAIYMADSGRFNVVGLSDEQVDRFITAVVETLDA
ncbi:aspartate/tyrosine/aromatic aminotransferase [Sphingomonas daechungensis]|uniref:Aspartate/tyrosine/aromatic aminotransferase n=1 Tax=Sphingomonas daechungensis TaxID=1176646 RepID=A0ABX6T038_9SPHN|nr:amino acid aminotransferase [Sphingomonas daechungensis]QNP42909.1 aspartate/tyrosine/aromatic aminotransferase [Sphingomonas daechungensis]